MSDICNEIKEKSGEIIDKIDEKLGDKIDAGDKSKVEAAVADLKKALEGTDDAKIKAETEKCTNVSYEVFGKIYQQQQQQGQQPPHTPNDGTSYGPNEGGDDNVVDADYEVVK